MIRLVGIVAVLTLVGGAWFFLVRDDGAAPDAAGTAGGPGAWTSGGGQGGRGGPGRDTLVVVAPVARSTWDDRLRAIGGGKAIASATVVPRDSGVPVDAAIVSGQRVAAGNVLAKLDSDAEEIARDIAGREVDDATVTVFTLLLTPVAYRLLAGLSKPSAAKTARQEAELSTARRSTSASAA